MAMGRMLETESGGSSESSFEHHRHLSFLNEGDKHTPSRASGIETSRLHPSMHANMGVQKKRKGQDRMFDTPLFLPTWNISSPQADTWWKDALLAIRRVALSDRNRGQCMKSMTVTNEKTDRCISTNRGVRGTQGLSKDPAAQALSRI